MRPRVLAEEAVAAAVANLEDVSEEALEVCPHRRIVLVCRLEGDSVICF